LEISIRISCSFSQILKKLLLPLNTDISEADVINMADNAHGFVGADLAAVCKEAGLHAVKRQVANLSDSFSVQKEDFLYAMKFVQPSAMREVAIDVPKVKSV
jgi:AAA family ATPase